MVYIDNTADETVYNLRCVLSFFPGRHKVMQETGNKVVNGSRQHVLNTSN